MSIFLKKINNLTNAIIILFTNYMATTLIIIYIYNLFEIKQLLFYFTYPKHFSKGKKHETK